MNLPPTIAGHLSTLLPESYKTEMTSFSFVPDFPNNVSGPNLVIITKHGEIIEFKDRRVAQSLMLQQKFYCHKIILHYNKNKNSVPTYILKGDNNLVFVGKDSNKKLTVLNCLNNVAKFELNDFISSGEAKIRVWLFDDAIPVELDEEYKIKEESFEEDSGSLRNDERFLLLMNRKLAEAKLNTAYNQKIYDEKKTFRHEVMYLTEDVSRYDREGTADEDLRKVDILTVSNIWQKVYNGKWVIGIPLENISDTDVNDIEVFLKCEDLPMLVFDTRIYIQTTNDEPPSWKLKPRDGLQAMDRAIIIATTDTPKFDESARITFHGAVRYTQNDKILCLPLQHVQIQISDVVNGTMDPVLCDNVNFCHKDVLTIVATSVQTNLDIHYLGDEILPLKSFLVDKLEFSLCIEQNMLRHCVSPLNILHGTAVQVSRVPDAPNKHQLILFSITENQALMFVNLLYDQMPVRCVIVPSGFAIKMKHINAFQSLSNTDSEKMDISSEIDTYQKETVLQEYASVMHEQMSAVSKHLEKCIEAMSEANLRNATSKSDASINIDVMALGNEKYEELWKFLIEKMLLRKDLLFKIIASSD